MLLAILLIVAAYLIGSIPIGYIVGRLKGIDLFQVGSGNIGATNAGRVLGRKFGILVFILDFLKGALPVALIVPAAKALNPDAESALGTWDAWRVAAATVTFLGHLFPIFLRFRGGKGVATGAGAVLVLMPGPAAVALLTWLAAVLASRYVSLASIAAVGALFVSRCLSVREPFAEGNLPITLFCLIGTFIVVVKHRTNIGRLRGGTESPINNGPSKELMLRMIHLMAVGMWFGAAAFNMITALPIFDSFKDVVANSPSDRTAYVAIVPEGTTDAKRGELASALAGAAVGPLFPRLFALAGICVWLAFVTACGWRNEPGKSNRWRIRIAAVALILIAASWPVSLYVSELRVLRFHPEGSIAKAAKDAFGPWHQASLLLSVLTTAVAGVLLAMGASLKERSVTNPPVAVE